MKSQFIIFILLIHFQTTIGQNNKKVHLKWKIKDSISYTTCFDEINKEFPDSIKLNAERDSTGQILFNAMKNLNKEFLKASFQSKMIKVNRHSYKIALSTLGLTVSKAETNVYGIPQNKLPNQENNFYLFFFKLPEGRIKIGDEWKLGLVVPKNLSSMHITDSTKYDNVKLINIEKTEKGRIATFAYSYLEEYKGTWNNTKTNNSGIAKISFRYTGVGKFNIDLGKWDDLDGVMELIAKGPMDGRSIRHVCMHENK